jgi:hypothetical protein
VLLMLPNAASVALMPRIWIIGIAASQFWPNASRTSGSATMAIPTPAGSTSTAVAASSRT